ncbi:MAG TPA: GGDEF domain-containing protein [Pedomonas sp.]|uniref:GGDEF domain-containing protein n=1 Tax=Pedomonas sp. TaxID=2976421 RepID=UPI002F3F2769
MDLFGTDPATVRTAVSAQLLFGAVFFSLSIRMLPGYRMLPLWALANLSTLAALVLEAVGTGALNNFAQLLGGISMASGAGLLWAAIRYNYNLPVNWRAGISVWAAAVVCIGLPSWLLGPDGLTYTLFYHLLCGLTLLAGLGDYARSQKGAWTVQSALLMVLMTAWGLFSVCVGVLRSTHLMVTPLEELIPATRNLLAAGTTLIIIALNFFGFLMISQRLSRELNQLASTDSLTGAMNRRAFHRRAATLFSAPAPAAYLLMLDLDHFKQINDHHGHAAGDQVLIRFTETVRGILRAGDLLGRTGGEEFSVLLPAADAQVALAVAERIRSSVEELRIEVEDGKPPLRVTVSIGIAPILPGATFDQVALEADKALYAAKNDGRNRVAWAISETCPACETQAALHPPAAAQKTVPEPAAAMTATALACTDAY